jgi:choline dehydrogenase
MQLSLTVLALAAQAAPALSIFDSGDSFGIPGKNASYDDVIVGGGTGGLTIAARLAEDKNASVAVIEAGGFYQIDNGNGRSVMMDSDFTSTRILSPSQCHPWPLRQSRRSSCSRELSPLIDWGFVTTPQPGFGNRSIHYTRGKTLGGSSALNFMLWHRGTNGSYDKWASEVEDESYTFDNLLPYFQRRTHINYPQDESLRGNATLHHDVSAYNNSLEIHQPLQVSWAKFSKSFSSWTAKVFSAVGVNSSPGLDSGELYGSSYSLTSITADDQHRESSQTSFLDYAMRTSDIKVYTQAMARRILFENNTATGMPVTTADKNYTITARKEVILSAGAFQSPQLLMVSGVGPKSTLEQHAILLVQDLPGVGQSMMEHIYFGVAHRVNVPTASTIGDEYMPGLEVQSDEAIWEWIQKDAITIWHASSTCKMGRAAYTLAVVDSKARVYGLQGLRVVDASAFPFLTPGHPQSGI